MPINLRGLRQTKHWTRGSGSQLKNSRASRVVERSSLIQFHRGGNPTMLIMVFNHDCVHLKPLHDRVQQPFGGRSTG